MTGCSMTRSETYLLKEDVSFSVISSGIAFRNKAGGLVLIEDIPSSLQAELVNILEQSKVEVVSKDSVFPIFEYLYKKKMAYIKPEQYIGWQQRTSFWVANLTGCYEAQKEILDESLIMILGAGGLGSIISHQLIQSGIKRIVMLDCAVLNEEDLNRQAIFSRADVGRSKVAIIKEKLEEEYEGTCVEVFNRKIMGDSASKEFIENIKPDLVFLCVDEPPSVSVDIVEAFVESPIPFIHGAVGLWDGKVSRVLDSSASKKEFISNCTNERQPLISSLAMTNSIVASHMALAGYSFLLSGDIGEARMINFK